MDQIGAEQKRIPHSCSCLGMSWTGRPVWFHPTTVVGGHHVVEVQLLEIGDQPEDEHRVTEAGCICLFDEPSVVLT